MRNGSIRCLFLFVEISIQKKKHAKNNISVGKTEDKDKIAYFLYYNLMSH